MKIHSENLIVPIKQVVLNDYNPKNENKKVIEQVKKSLKSHGQVVPILVRKIKGKKEYEVINGEHRIIAMKEEDYKEVEIKTLGELTREEAIAIALSTEDIKNEIDPIERAKLLKEVAEIVSIDELAEVLPYEATEINSMIETLDFDFEEFEEKPKKSDDPRVAIAFSDHEKYQEVISTIERVMEEQGIEDKSEALHTIICEYNQTRNA